MTDGKGKLKKGIFILAILLAMVVVTEAAIILFQQKRIDILENAIPYLIPGEEPANFDLIGMDNQTVSAERLEKNDLSVIFVFERPCNACNKNINYWKKFSGLLKSAPKVEVFGVVLDNYEDAFNFAQRAGLDFNLYVPRDPRVFVDAFKVRLNLAQTIILEGKKVVAVKVGNLQGRELKELMETVRNTLRAEKS